MTDAGEVHKRPFRFYDNRQKYLAFVTTCDEKWRVAERAGRELAHLRPQPPALRLFDAGVGDGTVLAHLLRTMHHRYPTVPFYVAGKVGFANPWSSLTSTSTGRKRITAP